MWERALGPGLANSTTDLANEDWIRANTWTCNQCGQSVPPLTADLGPLGRRLVRRAACPNVTCIPEWIQEEQTKAARKAEEEAQVRFARYVRDFPPAAMGDLIDAGWDNWIQRVGTERAWERVNQYADALVAGATPDPAGLLFFGVPGNGKSTLAALIANEARSEMKAVAWINVPTWLERIGGLEAAERNRLLDAAGDADLLVLDDLGTQNLTGPRIGWILRLIDARYRDRRPLIVTQNPSPGQLLQVLTTAAKRAAKTDLDADDGGLAEIEAGRIVDRLTEACRFVQIKAQSYRVFMAEERLKRGE